MTKEHDIFFWQGEHLGTSLVRDLPQLTLLSANMPLDKVQLSIDDQIVEVARISPSAAISLAWSSLEGDIKDAILRTSISPDYPLYNSSLKDLQLLRENGLINDLEFAVMERLRSIRNSVIHTHGDYKEITAEVAYDYARIVKENRKVLTKISRSP